MNTLETFLFTPSITQSLLWLTVVMTIGLWLGEKAKIRNFSLGVTWVLFVGIALASCGVMIDHSVVGYSLGLYLMYWAAFEYRRNDMLKSLSMTIFQNIGQGIVLFDHTGRLIMQNQQLLNIYLLMAVRQRNEVMMVKLHSCLQHKATQLRP